MPSPRSSSFTPRNDRQQAILRAAERLFAQRGFHAVTVRQIAEAAKVPLALVGYYFAHKEGLFRAIFAHHGPLHHEAMRALEDARRAAAAPGEADGLRRVVEAFVLPLLRWRHHSASQHYAQLLARELAQAAPEAEPALQEHVDPLLQRLFDALQAALPRASRHDLADALRFALGAVQAHLAEHRLDRLVASTRAGPASAQRLSEFIANGIRTVLVPAPTPVRAQPAERA
jgi:AcrR family transcriptional regulator